MRNVEELGSSKRNPPQRSMVLFEEAGRWVLEPGCGWVDMAVSIRADPLGSHLLGERLFERPLEPRLVLLCRVLLFKKINLRDSLVVQWLSLWAPNAGVLVLFPG